MVLWIKYFKTKYLNHLPFARKSFFLILKGLFPPFYKQDNHLACVVNRFTWVLLINASYIGAMFFSSQISPESQLLINLLFCRSYSFSIWFIHKHFLRTWYLLSSVFCALLGQAQTHLWPRWKQKKYRRRCRSFNRMAARWYSSRNLYNL